jgi:predicted neuraminidase
MKAAGRLLRLICALTCVIALGTRAASAVDSAQQLELIMRTVVFNDPTTDPYDPANRYGFNHAPSVIKLANGDLLCAWFSGPFEAAVNQAILAARSHDGGKTWDKAIVLQDTPHKSDFDPAFLADKASTLFCYTVGRWNQYPLVSPENGGVGVNSFRLCIRRTNDNGATWSDVAKLDGRLFCRSNGILLKSGRLLLPVYRAPENGEREQAGVLMSDDDGKSWNVGGLVSTAAGADEPTIAETASGNIVMVLRTTDGFLWKTKSEDQGQTWSTPEKTVIEAAASSSNLFCLTDGRLVLTHGPCKPSYRTPLTMRLSSDDSVTWGPILQLAEVKNPPSRDKAWQRQVTYPSVAQLDDATLVVVWTDIGISDEAHYGNIWAAQVRALDTGSTPTTAHLR